MDMQNKIWEQVGQFLNRLRCENVARDTAVEVPGYKEAQEEVEGLREKCEAVMQQLPQEQRQLLLEWMAKLEEGDFMVLIICVLSQPFLLCLLFRCRPFSSLNLFQHLSSIFFNHLHQKIRTPLHVGFYFRAQFFRLFPTLVFQDKHTQDPLQLF